MIWRSDRCEVTFPFQDSEVRARSTRQSKLALKLSRLASERGVKKKGNGSSGCGVCHLEGSEKPIEIGLGTGGDGSAHGTSGGGRKQLMVCRGILQVDDRLLDEVCGLLLLR